jgi:SAM-dependent methyltransferase
MANQGSEATQEPETSHRTFSSGHDRSRIASYLALFRHYRKNRQFARRHYEIFCRVREAFEQHGHVPVENADILEIGCGQRFPLTLLFHSLGARCVGIDYDYVDPRPRWHSFHAMMKRNGAERAVKTLIRSALFDRAYQQSLEHHLGRTLRLSGISLRVMDATSLHFPDGQFDYACSSDVFEHIADVDAATREMARVLRLGGVAYVGINVFAGISGGHHFEWAEPDRSPSRRVPPWDHLRQNLFPSQAYLNKLRESDYVAIFSRHFEVVDVQSVYQGQAQLTAEIQQVLSAYSRHELLQGGLTAILRKA